MTPNQRMIKNCAIVLAACLVIGIVFIALNIIVGVCGAFIPNHKDNVNTNTTNTTNTASDRNDKNNSNKNTTDSTTIDKEDEKMESGDVYENVKNLKIKSGIYKVRIERDSSIKKGVKVQLENVSSDYKVEYKESSETLEMEGDSDSIIHFWKDREAAKGVITLTVSDHTELDRIKIEMGVGSVTIEDMNVAELDVECGVGIFTCENVRAEYAQIKGGVGSVKCSEVQFDGLEMEGGIGGISVDGVLTGKTSVVAGMGTIELEIHVKREDYNLNVETGLGSIYVDGEKCSDIKESNNSQNNLLNVEGGIGSVKINFN